MANYTIKPSGNFEKIRQAWELGEVLTSHVLIERTGLSSKTVFNVISHLRRRGEVEKVDEDVAFRKGTLYKRAREAASVLANREKYSYNAKIMPRWISPKMPKMKVKSICEVRYE